MREVSRQLPVDVLSLFALWANKGKRSGGIGLGNAVAHLVRARDSYSGRIDRQNLPTSQIRPRKGTMQATEAQ